MGVAVFWDLVVVGQLNWYSSWKLALLRYWRDRPRYGKRCLLTIQRVAVLSRTHGWLHTAHLNMLRHIKLLITRFQLACDAGLIPDVLLPTGKRSFELDHAGRRKITDFVEGKGRLTFGL